MKTRAFLAVLGVIGLLATRSGRVVAGELQAPGGSNASTSQVDAEVRHMLTGYFRAIEQRDLAGFLAFFAEGEDFTVFEDKEMYDWKGFVAFAESFFQQIKTIRFELEKCRVDPLASTFAVATGVFKGAGTITSGEPLAVRNAYTFVLVRKAGRWRIKHVHESSL